MSTKKDNLQDGHLISAFSSSLEFHVLVLWSHMFLTESFQKPRRLLQPVSQKYLQSLEQKGIEKTMRSNHQNIEITHQLRFFGVHPHNHVLITCRQQVTNAIIRYGEFFLAFIILKRNKDIESCTLKCGTYRKSRRTDTEK